MLLLWVSPLMGCALQRAIAWESPIDCVGHWVPAWHLEEDNVLRQWVKDYCKWRC